MPDRHIGAYYTVFGTYWVEAVYQYHRRSAPESILLDSTIGGRYDIYYSFALGYDFLLLFSRLLIRRTYKRIVRAGLV